MGGGITEIVGVGENPTGENVTTSTIKQLYYIKNTGFEQSFEAYNPPLTVLLLRIS